MHVDKFSFVESETVTRADFTVLIYKDKDCSGIRRGFASFGASDKDLHCSQLFKTSAFRNTENRVR